MPITVVTIDFWNTLFDSSGGESRNAARRQTLRDAIRDAGLFCPDERLEDAYKGIWEYFDHHWLEKQRTPTSEEMVREICRRADAALSENAIMAVAERFSRGILDHPPSLLPGAHDALEYLASRARLAIISDTAFSAGSVLRELMEINGIAHYFTAFVFSDETGVAKPHPEAFHHALRQLRGTPSEGLHIGDIERTDIRGAKAVGMKAALYKGDAASHKYSEDETAADVVIEGWVGMNRVLGAFM
jgi:putative hydrolase of the HAD superfamily